MAAAGITTIRTGAASWGAEITPGLIQAEREKAAQAAAHGLFTWLWLGPLDARIYRLRL